MRTTIQVRTEKKLKEDVQTILDGIGLDLSTAINMYLTNIRNSGGIPFDVIVKKKVAEIKAHRAMKAIKAAHKPAKKAVTRDKKNFWSFLD